MATISYKCDTCKRNIELVENSQGFTVFGKCVITNGCRGKLYKTERNPNNVRESAPTFTGGVDNYVPRRAFNEFTQGLMSDKWKVSHGLGTTPATFVYELTGDGQTVPIDNSYYTVQEVDKNNIILIFPRKMRGIVQSVARSTVPLIPSTLPEDEIVLQASSKGIITFAIPKYLTQIVGNIPDVSPPAITPTLTPSPTPTSTPVNLPLGLCTVDDIQIEIEIIRPNEEPVVCFERIPYQVDNKSPWTGWNEVLIRKRRNYCIRTVNILSLKIFGNANLKATDIPNGTRIRFLRIDYGTGRTVEIPSRGLLMLLSQNPHEYVDKIKDRLIDVGELIGDVPNYFVYNDGELFLDESKVEKTYPDISRVITRAPTIPAFSPTPTPSVTASATPPPSPEASYTPTPTPEPSISPSPSPTPTPTPVATCDVFAGENAWSTDGDGRMIILNAFNIQNLPAELNPYSNYMIYIDFTGQLDENSYWNASRYIFNWGTERYEWADGPEPPYMGEVQENTAFIASQYGSSCFTWESVMPD